MQKLTDYLKEHRSYYIKKLKNPVDIYTVIRMLNMPDLRPLKMLGGLAVKQHNYLYIIQDARKNCSPEFEEPWEIVSKSEFLSGIEKEPIHMLPLIDEKFYFNKYFIIEVKDNMLWY